MTYKLVDIIAFDAHTAVKPLVFPNLIKPDYRFLVDPEKYGQQYELWQPIETDLLSIRPIKKREFSHNHFWRNYAAMSFSLDRDYWGLQIPFMFEPKNFDLKINMGGFAFKAALAAVVYLNSMGWSSRIKIRLSGNIESQQLQEFVGRLRGLDKENLPFVIAGESHALTSVFKALGRIVRNSIYTSPDAVGDTIAVASELIISLAHSTSEPKYFKEKWGIAPWMVEGEQAEILGVLYGSTIEPDRVKDYLDQTLVTRFGGANFSLTKFKLGTLLFMQQEAFKEQEAVQEEQDINGFDKSDPLECLASNVGTSTMMSLAMDYFNRSASKSPRPSPALSALREQVISTLIRLPDSYTNPYYRNFCRHHPSLKKYMQQDDSAEAGTLDE